MDSSETTRPTPNLSEPQAQSNLSSFTGAHDFNIGEQHNQVVNFTFTTSRDLCSILNPIADASFARDRKASPPDSNCLPGTREKVIGKIQTWIDSSILLKPQHVMWIYGYVGCGKSSIAQAVAKLYAGKDRLAGSFFFFRGSGDRSKTARFAATMAGQLAAAIPGTASYVEQAVRAHAGLLTTYTIGEQFEHMVYRPLKTFSEKNFFLPSLLRDPYLIVIDGLDECDDREEIAAFIEDMLDYFKKNPRIPLRFLIASRVEEHIRTRLNSSQVHLFNLVDHTSLDDISAIVNATFTLAAKHNRAYGDWPSPNDRQKLIEHSGGSVIFASTILKFILGDSSDGLTPSKRLPQALNINPGLDGLYSQTLSRSEHLPHFIEIIASIVTFLEPQTVVQLANLLSIQNFEVIEVLVNLHSILHVPDDDHTPITICHTSLRDFLHNEGRSQRFFISTETHGRLFTQLFRSCYDKPSALRTIATVALLPKHISFSRLASLLDMGLATVAAHLDCFRPVIRIPKDIRRASLGPHALHMSLPAFLLTQARSGPLSLNPAHGKELAWPCFRLIARSLREHEHDDIDGDNLRIYAISHWNAFLKTLSPNALAAQFDETLLFLIELVGELIARGVLLLLLTLEGLGPRHNPLDILSEVAGSLGSRCNPLGILSEVAESFSPRESGGHDGQVAGHQGKKIAVLVGEVLMAVGCASHRTLSTLKLDIIDEIPDEMPQDSLKVIAYTHLAVLYSLKSRAASRRLNGNDVDSQLELTDIHTSEEFALDSKALTEASCGSPAFISEFTAAIIREHAPYISLPLRYYALKPHSKVFRRVYYRLLALAHRRSSRALTIVSTITLLDERLTIYQLSYFLHIPATTIRSVLGRLRGILDVPETDFECIVSHHRQTLCAFLRRRADAKEFYIGPDFEEELMRRCLSTWIEWTSVDEDLATVRDYCRGYWEASVERIAVDHIQRCQQLAKAITYFGNIFSPGTVEFVLWTFVATTSDLGPIVQSWEDDDDLKTQAMALGCRQDVANLVGTQVLLCAEAIRVLQRHFLPLGPLVTTAELEDRVWDELFLQSRSGVSKAGGENGVLEGRG